MAHANNMPLAGQPNAPCGGKHNPCLGRVHGRWILEEFTRPHWATVQQPCPQAQCPV